MRPMNYVVNVALNMQFYPPKDWLVGSSMPSKFTPGIIEIALKELIQYNSIHHSNIAYLGNVEPDEAESMIQHLEDTFFKSPRPISQALFASQHSTKRVVNLERGINYFYSAEGLNPSDENSALIHYIQVHQDDFKLNVKLQLFALIAKPAFHQLRSEWFWVHDVHIIIQSNVKGPGRLD
ncbi:Zinc-metallopeptidase [Forsythia ovata]|uniref:Zinc-metallopeptidase n=1 Tax=Forsythia ovata TaxID=205694 RepID=A0ABD1XAA5_9LAMI